MAGKYNYEKMRKYPHLLGEDIPVWDRFIEKYPDRFDTINYDVHVGIGIAPAKDTEAEAARQYILLTQKRIDAVGWKNDQPTIIEIKNRVGLDTLGQVLGYRVLYLQEYPEILGLPILIVCAFIGPDDISVLNHFSVPFVIV